MTFQFISLAWTSLLNSSLIAPATHLRAPLGGILDTSLFDTPYPNRQQTLLLLLSKQCLYPASSHPLRCSPLVQRRLTGLPTSPLALQHFTLSHQSEESSKHKNQSTAFLLSKPSTATQSHSTHKKCP